MGRNGATQRSLHSYRLLIQPNRLFGRLSDTWKVLSNSYVYCVLMLLIAYRLCRYLTLKIGALAMSTRPLSCVRFLIPNVCVIIRWNWRAVVPFSPLMI